MRRVVTGMTSNPVAQAGTALSPEWDRGFDEAFTELICSDTDLVRAEFDALIGASFDEPPGPPAPPAPSAARPAPAHPHRDPAPTPAARDAGHRPSTAGNNPRSPPHPLRSGTDSNEADAKPPAPGDDMAIEKGDRTR
jgi:hypothetical protein